MNESSGQWAFNESRKMLPVLIHTLGCKLNQLESEAITDAFLNSGFFVKSETPPSLIVINTCTVTSKADQKARRVIRKALRDYPDVCVLVTGCYAKLNREELYKLETDGAKRLFIFDNNYSILKLPRFLVDKKDIQTALKSFFENAASTGCSAVSVRIADIDFGKDGGNRDTVSNPRDSVPAAFQFNPERFSNHTRSFLKIQDGCDKQCTYCRIRLARGPSVSLNADEILARLRILEKDHCEAVLTGVNISQYRGEKDAANLAELLNYMLCGTKKISLRLSSLTPESIDENFAQILSNKRIRPHFHLSIQSGSKKVLEKMGRAYDSQTIERAASLLRSAKDDPFLACDIIAGFPGETNEEFEETYELCKKLDFAWIHVFPYSKRPGTPAFSFSGAVHEAEIAKRVQILTYLAKQGKTSYTRRWLEREVDVLVEKGSISGTCRGLSENYLKLLIQHEGKAPPPGAVLRCRLIEEASHTGDMGRKIKDYDAVAEKSRN